MKEEYLKRTCIFCGEDSPSQGGREIIEWCSEHIKKCEHHPMRKLEEKLRIAMEALDAVEKNYGMLHSKPAYYWMVVKALDTIREETE